MARRCADTYALASAVAEQALSGIRTVYAFSLQRRFATKYDQNLAEVRDAEEKRAKLFGLSLGAFNCLLFLIFAFGFWYASRMVIKSEMGGPAVVVGNPYCRSL